MANLPSKKAFSKASANERRFIFSMVAKNVNLDFCRPCRGFRRFFQKACRSINASGMREKTSKNLRRKSPKPSPEPSGTLLNPTRSASEREKIEWDGQDCLDCLDKWLDKGLWSRTNGPNGSFWAGGTPSKLRTTWRAGATGRGRGGVVNLC